ncbi:helix-turn-helix transcriptional regulator [Amycolatopsis oliviviridis]|nr:LuxR C-terminal-related transcriptional regulator [Amycolatopsis oliviviridis]
MVSCFGSRTGMKVVDGSPREDADVVVAAFESLTAEAIAALRRCAGTGKPIVLMLDRIRESELPVVVECRVVRLLPRAAVAGEELPDIVRAAAAGVTPFGTLFQQAERFRGGFLRIPEPAATGLSPRETEVLRLMAEGLDTNAIAAELSYSERTVKNIIYAMTSRLKLRNRSHAVAYALRTGAI